MSLTGPLDAAAHGGLELRREPLEIPRSRTRAGQLGLVGLVFTVAVLCLCAAQTDAILPQTVRPIPAWMAGVFGSAGFNLGPVGLVLVLGFMFASYAVVATRADRLSGRTVLACIAALHALVLLAPPLFSTDVFSYQAYARIFAHYHAANPYLIGPGAFRYDPLYAYIGSKWVGTPSAYGPLFTAFSALLAPLSMAAIVVAYKVVAAVASLCVVALVWNTARVRGLNPVRAAALVGLNPLVVVYGVGGGHNDLLMLAAMVAAVSLLLQHRDRLRGASLVMATAIKLTGGIIAPFALADVAKPFARRRRRDLLLGAAVTTVVVAVLSQVLFGTGPLHLLSTLRHNQGQGDWRSIPGFVSTRLGLGTIGEVTGYLLGAAFLAVLVWLVRRVARGQLDWIDGTAFATAAMIVTASSLLPWYVAWMLPLAALGRDRRLPRMALIITGIVMGIDMLGYIPNGASVLGL